MSKYKNELEKYLLNEISSVICEYLEKYFVGVYDGYLGVYKFDKKKFLIGDLCLQIAKQEGFANPERAMICVNNKLYFLRYTEFSNFSLTQISFNNITSNVNEKVNEKVNGKNENEKNGNDRKIQEMVLTTFKISKSLIGIYTLENVNKILFFSYENIGVYDIEKKTYDLIDLQQQNDDFRSIFQYTESNCIIMKIKSIGHLCFASDRGMCLYNPLDSKFCKAKLFPQILDNYASVIIKVKNDEKLRIIVSGGETINSNSDDPNFNEEIVFQNQRRVFYLNLEGNKFEKNDPWINLPDLNIARAFHSMFQVRNFLIVIGGYSLISFNTNDKNEKEIPTEILDLQNCFLKQENNSKWQITNSLYKPQKIAGSLISLDFSF